MGATGHEECIWFSIYDTTKISNIYVLYTWEG